MQEVPLAAIPAQKVTVQLGGQVCQVTVRQMFWGLFLDLSVNNSRIIAGVLCLNKNLIVRSAYLGFSGDLCFVDTQGDESPGYAGIGTRYSLLYLTAEEAAAALAAEG